MQLLRDKQRQHDCCTSRSRRASSVHTTVHSRKHLSSLQNGAQLREQRKAADCDVWFMFFPLCMLPHDSAGDAPDVSNKLSKTKKCCSATHTTAVFTDVDCGASKHPSGAAICTSNCLKDFGVNINNPNMKFMHLLLFYSILLNWVCWIGNCCHNLPLKDLYRGQCLFIVIYNI